MTMKLLLAAAASCAASLAHAQTYPSKPIRLIVPNAPGGGTDTVARVIADKLSPALGQQVVVDNRGGAGGRIAAEGVARAPRDGYTLLLGSAATLITGPVLDGDRKYDPTKDFAYISMAGKTAYMLVVHPSLPAGNVRELVALARAQPRRITYASSGQGSPAHLGMELLQAMSKARFVHVPYKGGAPAMLSLFQGENFVMIANFLTALPAARQSRVRALGVTSLARTRLAPDLPTIAETGLPGFELQQFYSLVAPAGIPADVVARLSHEMAQRFAAEDSRRRLDGEGVEVMTSTPQEAAALYAAEYAKWARVIRSAGIKSEG
ncbi:MAG TPA: tripartite tricarboxylate transporter substrate binding protein [Burkholderiales bacterium]|nr:tripartite tricarboxylate transporter substrate binding protein [Burkholderiales bacterium]